MGLWNKIAQLVRQFRNRDRRQQGVDDFRKCRFETMENRRLLSADPLRIGAVYVEGDIGSDVHGDTFEVTFVGGAADTQLTRLVINGDQATAGFGEDDVIFDTQSTGKGADNSSPFQVVSLQSQNPQANVTASVEDGSTSLTLDLSGFQAGDKLVFSIDVDEVEIFDPAETDPNIINEGFDPITSGVEFQSTKLTAFFTAPHFHDITGTTQFQNHYDDEFSGSGLNLPADDDGGMRDRSDGAILQLTQTPLPIAISGTVYLDNNLNLAQESSEPGLANVSLSLWQKQGTGYTFTGFTTQTNAQGNYEFGTGLNLLPGTYEVRETQPSGLFSVGAIPGSVDGISSGTIVAGDRDVLTEIGIPLGGQLSIDNDFAEAQPARLSGYVYHDRSNDGVRDSNEEGLAGVAIQIIPVDTIAAQVPLTVLTDATGFYEADGLVPGSYRVEEVVQPNGYFDGLDTPGTVDGTPLGTATNPGDSLAGIVLAGGQAGSEYNFGEISPSSIAGRVHLDFNGNCELEAGEQPLSGVTIQLLDNNGNILATTLTDENGLYKFSGLLPGVYGIREIQPGGVLQGLQHAGSNGGNDTVQDLITDINIGAGQDLVEYDFCEFPPASIAGLVHLDSNGNCELEPGELPLSGVTIQLLDSNGNILATTLTDENGQYKFSDLASGVYGIREIQPAGVFQGLQHAGSNGGNDTVPDLITEINIGAGQDLVEYDFCEFPPGSIAGQVRLDTDGDCLLDDGEGTLSGVTIQLLDADNNLLATTLTDNEGRYKFTDLAPGEYSVRELQPTGVFHGDQHAGSNGGTDTATDLISNVDLGPGQNLVDYDFCEMPPANLSGYVFQDGATIVTSDGQVPGNLGELRDGLLTPDDQRLAGVLLELRDGFTGTPIDGSEALPGTYPAGPIQVRTDASGFYEFRNIPGGRSYAVFEVHPEGYADSIDTVGTTTGFAFNPQVDQGTLTIEPLAGQPASDAIIRIAVAPGQSSTDNNFSEVKIDTQLVPPPPPPPVFPPPPVSPPPPVYIPGIVMPAITNPPPTYMVWSAPNISIFEAAAGGSIGYSWHLSVINGGLPRDLATATGSDAPVWHSATLLDKTEWNAERLREGQWIIGANASGDAQSAARVIGFGIRGAIPIVGDFDGDGQSQIGLFYRGEWFIDLNGNGQWDEEDLWAKMGDELDRPVVGDWDGDGKDDIGIHGPEWFGDQRQIVHEPGLPDSHNNPHEHVADKPKNMPPNAEDATDGQRLLRFHSNGPRRADVIDHVFRYGGEADSPVAGDWNGDGIRTVGIYSDGVWRVDSDGDGLVGPHDQEIRFGREGDVPLVGDWDGNGIEEIGVYRGGKWILDSNGNRELDAHDRVFEMGGATDRPVVGDWNGDGIDEPAIYREPPVAGDSTIR